MQLARDTRDNYALPLLLPLALLAAPAAVALPAWAGRCWDWSARLLWGAFAVFLWSTWIWMTLHHRAPRLPGIANVLPLDFVPEFSLAAFAAAAALTARTLVLAHRYRRFAGRGLGSWFAGTAMAWALLSTLWLPWIDAAKSYRSVFEMVRTALPARYECVAQRGMGESELSMLSYFLGISATGLDSAQGTLRRAVDQRGAQRTACRSRTASMARSLARSAPPATATSASGSIRERRCRP